MDDDKIEQPGSIALTAAHEPPIPVPENAADSIQTHEDLPEGSALRRVLQAMHADMMVEINDIHGRIDQLHARIPIAADYQSDAAEPWRAEVTALHTKIDAAVQRIHKMFG
jgi:hypothetical protein